jgi:hypothetical protein
MDASEFPSPNSDEMRGIVPAEIEASRARVEEVHNSRILLATFFLLTLCAGFIAICSVLVAVWELFPIGALTLARGIGAAQWAFSALFFAYMGTVVWKMASNMTHPFVRLDSSGVQFHLGTKKAPIQLSLPWDKVAVIQQQRVGNARQFTVQASDGSYARFTSYTFFRPKKVARLIAERTGLVIQKS